MKFQVSSHEKVEIETFFHLECFKELTDQPRTDYFKRLLKERISRVGKADVELQAAFGYNLKHYIDLVDLPENLTDNAFNFLNEVLV